MKIGWMFLFLQLLYGAICIAEWDEEYVISYVGEGPYSPGIDLHHDYLNDLWGPAVLFWCEYDPYYGGDIPSDTAEWATLRVRFFHFGEGLTRISLVSIPYGPEYIGYGASLLWSDYYDTTCSDCWEEVDINQDCSGDCGTWPGPLLGVVIESVVPGGTGSYPILGIDLSQVHPNSSALYHGMLPPDGYYDITYLSDLPDGNPQRGNLAIELIWVYGETETSTEMTWTAMKRRYK